MKMAKQFRYRLKDKIAFYLEYFVFKVFLIWFEVKKPKLKMFFYELLYSAKKFFDYASLLPSPFRDDIIKTRFGIFKIRPNTVDMSNVSPAFERRDVNYLLGLIRKLKNDGKKILFVDVGADIGTFTITIGNAFRDYDKLSILAFEPAKSSYALLEENIKINNLHDKVKIYKFALFNQDNREIEFHFNPEAPGSSGLKRSYSAAGSQKVITKTLDSVLSDKVNAYDCLICKIDVEGVETEVVQGGENTLHSVKDIYLLVEDFINPSIINYLETRNIGFLCKLTPYNSWWHKC
jgi:FkbM family methyltransferase